MSYMKRDLCLSRWRVIALNAITLMLVTMLSANTVNAQVVATYDFEDGTAQGWTSFNGASVPANSTVTAFNGTSSLLTTTNSGGASSGPSLVLTGLLPGATYQITGHIMLTTGETATSANFTVQRQDPGCSGGTCYDTIGTYQVPVSDSGWAQIGGAYTISTSATSMVLYAQLVGPTTTQSFYIDDVVVTEIAGPPGGPQDNSGITSTFEDGDVDGWSSRAGSLVTNSSADAHSGTHSLLTTGRVQAYDGPQINVSNKMYNGSQYSISVWVKLGPSATQADTIRMSLQTTLAGSTSYHTVVGNTAIPTGQWVLLNIRTYSMALAYDPGQAFLYVESNSGTQDFYIDDFKVTYVPPAQIQTDIPSIYQTLSQYFPVGAAIGSSDLSGVHAQLLTKHFNSIVSGNDMKWSSVEATEGTFDYAAADAQVSFAQKNNLRVRGHNLVWANGAQTPQWVFLQADGVTPLSASNPADVALLTQRIQNHIMNEVQHFGTATYVWDVVNEPLDASQSDCLTHGPFYQVLGESYLDIAFRAARQYAPAGTELFLNDYSTTDSDRLQCLINLLDRLKRRGVPVDGMGHEMHVHIDNPSALAVFNAIETLHLRFPHLRQQITELDVSVYPAGDNSSNYGATGGDVPPYLIAEQGWFYEKYFKALRALKGKVEAVTIWGLGDDNTWLDNFPINRLDEPLPFDTRLQAKPAYWGIVDPTHLPGYGLSFALTSQNGTKNSQTWTVTATNPSADTAYITQVTGFFLWQVKGRPCAPPNVTPVSTLMLGDIPSMGTASTTVTVDFHRCGPETEFELYMPWNSAKYETGVFVLKHLHP